MKRTILTMSALAALLLSAGSAWAQVPNTVTAQQEGNGQLSRVEQAGQGQNALIDQRTNGASRTNEGNIGIIFQGKGGAGSFDQQATILQTGGSQNNRAGITQDGPSRNTALIEQIGSGGAGLRSESRENAGSGAGNWAGIQQNGNGNQGTVLQNEVVGEPTFEGEERPLGPIFDGSTTKNFGEVWQYGNGNEGFVNQSGSTDNRAEIYQGNDTRSSTVASPPAVATTVAGNLANILQDFGSARNDGAIRQFSNGNRANIQQFGSTSQDNVADIRQGLASDQPNSGGNEAFIYQVDNSLSNRAAITQEGGANDADIEQVAALRSENNQATITQAAGANGNQATIFQGSLAIQDDVAENNRAEIKQAGDGDEAYITQERYTSSSQAYAEQGAGSYDNYIDIRQLNTTNGSATATQNRTATGTGNLIMIEQGTTTLAATNVSATIGQEGSNNTAKLRQTGNGHSATADQIGNNNVLRGLTGEFATQTGPGGNSLTLEQRTGNGTAFNNTLQIGQESLSGLGNSATVSQTLSASAVGGNLSTINQLGSGNSAAVTQVNGINN